MGLFWLPSPIESISVREADSQPLSSGERPSGTQAHRSSITFLLLRYNLAPEATGKSIFTVSVILTWNWNRHHGASSSRSPAENHSNFRKDASPKVGREPRHKLHVGASQRGAFDEQMTDSEGSACCPLPKDRVLRRYRFVSASQDKTAKTRRHVIAAGILAQR